MKKELKYQYHIQLWGGFYNDNHKKKHGFEPGDYLFDTKEQREKYLNNLETISEKLNAKMLAYTKTEGFNCDTRTVLHRVTEFEDKIYYTERDLGINYPYDSAKYMIEWKWTPGCNDYPLGEDFEYDERQNEYNVHEWITGAFDSNEE